MQTIIHAAGYSVALTTLSSDKLHISYDIIVAIQIAVKMEKLWIKSILLPTTWKYRYKCVHYSFEITFMSVKI